MDPGTQVKQIHKMEHNPYTLKKEHGIVSQICPSHWQSIDHHDKPSGLEPPR